MSLPERGTPALLGLLLASFLVASCGDSHDTSSTAAPTVDAAPTSYPEPVTRPWPIARVRRGPTPTTVLVDVAGLPGDTAGRCATSVSTELNEQPLEVGIGIDVASRLEPPFPGCVRRTRTLTVRLHQSLGTRDVVASGAVTATGGRFVAVGEGYQECTGGTCDPQVDRQPANCAHLREAISGADVPMHFRMSGPCREPYAAIVVDLGAGACPARDDGPNPCAGQRLTDQFWVTDGSAWRLVLDQRGGTCADARRKLPAFPAALCDDPTWKAAQPG